MRRDAGRALAITLLTSALYFVAARFGLLLALEKTNASPVWPPSGIALAAVLLLGRRVWPGILLGAFLSNLLVFIHNFAQASASLVAVSAAIAAGNTLEALAGHALFRRFVGTKDALIRVESVFRFVVISLAVCLVAASIGTSSLVLGDLLGQVPAGAVWLTWWLGDVAGILVLAPLALIWSSPSSRREHPGGPVEAVGLLALIVLASWQGFGSTLPLIFLIVPPLIWTSLRFGPRGAAAAVMLVSGIALWSTVHGLGPFAGRPTNEALLLVQSFVCVLAVTYLALSAAVTERQSAQGQLRASQEILEQRVAERTAVAEHQTEELRRLATQLVGAEQLERRRLSRILHDQVQQLLVAIQFRLARLAATSGTMSVDAESVRRISGLVSQVLGTLRDLTVHLSPPILQDRGLPAAVEWLARDMKEKQGLTVTFEARECESLDESTRMFVYEAIRELLFNVVKHGETREAALRIRGTPGGWLDVDVSDAGRGFDPRSSMGARDGFGLFSIRERVRSLGGQVTVESAPGRGTRVRMLVPRLGAPARGENGQTGPAGLEGAQLGNAPDGDIHVLIADDHAIVREGLVSLLERERGIRVVAQASDGEQAVRLARELSPHVAILDVSMPHMGGLEAARRIRQDAPQVRVIGLSMYQDPDMARAMKAAGAMAYLSKDRAGEDLAALIREAGGAPAS
ncbi:MAG: MASE1 domain-containing protein [Candidatus Polarisedimenticolia bacterium]